MICEMCRPGKTLPRSVPSGLLAILFCILISVICPNGHCMERESFLSLPQTERKILAPSGEIEPPEVSESSGLVKSRQWPDVFWTHNDSSNAPKIYAIRKDGSCIDSVRGPNCPGVEIPCAKNDDWEDVAADNKGNLIIADLGDNRNRRRDLSLYMIKEPNPYGSKHSGKALKFRVCYPDRTKIPPDKMNFDCEAVVWARGKIFVLTKHRSDAFTKLYRLDSMNPSAMNRLTLVDRFLIGGKVTGADASPDGNRLAVLTYGSVWLFEAKGKSESWFKGKIRWLPISADQCEGIALDRDKLIITNEQRQCFEVPIESLLTVRQ